MRACKGAFVPPSVVPRTPAKDALGTVSRSPRAAIAWGATVSFVETILCPLPHVATHVIQAPGVGLLAGHWHRLLATVASPYCHVVPVVATTVHLANPGTAGVLPFRLAGQAELLATDGVEFLDVCLDFGTS